MGNVAPPTGWPIRIATVQFRGGHLEVKIMTQEQKIAMLRIVVFLIAMFITMATTATLG